jgi:hypothetical protein
MIRSDGTQQTQKISFVSLRTPSRCIWSPNVRHLVYLAMASIFYPAFFFIHRTSTIDFYPQQNPPHFNQHVTPNSDSDRHIHGAVAFEWGFGSRERKYTPQSLFEPRLHRFHICGHTILGRTRRKRYTLPATPDAHGWPGPHMDRPFHCKN